MTMRTMSEFTDWDAAAYQLAKSIGILDENATFQGSKHIFWTNSEMGEILQKMLGMLVWAGVLEGRSEPDRQFRWKGTDDGA